MRFDLVHNTHCKREGYLLFAEAVFLIKRRPAGSRAYSRNLVIDSYMHSIGLAYFIGMFSRRQLLYAVRQNAYLHFVVRFKAQLIRELKPAAVGVVAVLLRTDIIHIFAACVRRMNAYHAVVPALTPAPPSRLAALAPSPALLQLTAMLLRTPKNWLSKRSTPQTAAMFLTGSSRTMSTMLKRASTLTTP